MAESSGITRARKERAQQYGSYENYQNKMALWRSESTAATTFRDETLKAYRNAPVGARKLLDDLIDEAEHQTPFWMNPFILSTLDLALIGSPEGSNEWEWDSNGTYGRGVKPVEVTYQDYSALGWPTSAGTPIRKVTKWEHAEILRRLKAGGLTKPGAEVRTIGKTLAEMIEDDEPEPEWIIEGILREGGASMVYGPSGIGKTWFTHTLMFIAAAGKGAGILNPQTDQWILKAGPHEGVNVCLIDGEMITADIAGRAKTLCGALRLQMVGSVSLVKPLDLEELRLSLVQGGTDSDEAAEIIAQLKACEDAKPESLKPLPDPDAPFVDLSKIKIFPKAAQDHRAEFVDLSDPEWKSRIVEFCREHNIKVLILNNLSTLNEGLEDENAATAWSPLNALVVSLKNEGVATILVHHANKAGSGFRGSSNLVTTLETVIALEDAKGAKKDAQFRISFEKNRAHGQPEADGKTLRLEEGRWVCDVDPLSQAMRVVEMVKSLHYKKQQDIADEIGVDQATVSRIFMAVECMGLVKEGDLQDTLREARALHKRMASPAIEPDEDDGPDL